MELIDNMSRLLGDDLKQTIQPGALLKIAASRWVLSDYFATDWLPMDDERTAMPVAQHLDGLYEQLLHRSIPLPARPQETLAELVARVEQAQAKQRELDKATARLAKEKQFNRKVEINAELRKLKYEVNRLMAS